LPQIRTEKIFFGFVVRKYNFELRETPVKQNLRRTRAGAAKN
jgi:hypothetical protein